MLRIIQNRIDRKMPPKSSNLPNTFTCNNDQTKDNMLINDRIIFISRDTGKKVKKKSIRQTISLYNNTAEQGIHEYHTKT